MSDPYRPPVTVQFPPTADEKALQLLSTFHLVVGVIIALFSCLFVVHIAIGVHALRSPDAWAAAGMRAQQALPPAVAQMFIIMGTVCVLLGWCMAALTALAGRCIARRRRYVFCTVIAGLLCVWMPFGTILGVFTLVTLTKPHVRALFETSGGTLASTQ